MGQKPTAHAPGQGGADHHAGHVFRDAGLVASQARRVVPYEGRLVLRVQREEVEGCAIFRVDARHLENPDVHRVGVVTNETDVRVVVEVDRAGRPGSDTLRLEARPREDQHL